MKDLVEDMIEGDDDGWHVTVKSYMPTEAARAVIHLTAAEYNRLIAEDGGEGLP